MLAGEAGCLAGGRLCCSGRPVGESSLTFASRGRLATPSGTSRPRCSDGGRVVAAVGGSRVGWVAGRGGRRRCSLLGCGRLCDHAATISSSIVPQIQVIDSGWLFLLCGQRRVLTVQTVQPIVEIPGAALGPVPDMPVVQRGAQFACFSEKHRDSPVAVH